ncbi:hypothetical protein FE784_18045 [Paenibacillus hemerocallicola]|uniref:Heparinase II/III-like C-terminal domain-containing protein n=1 Tax=Paenibacillus hemerocallicola TaxID=1172614 RepID=A0A5C4T7L1_9BACL|nr:carboxypeptidase regulatory-like domain-containing protein [Paenibacillus hemerocallicola]TNJ64932.1 hypothetical protein FE784_18045 [Paenibacillus hemerocallicola]
MGNLLKKWTSSSMSIIIAASVVAGVPLPVKADPVDPQPIAHRSDKWAVIPEWSADPVIDGQLDESIWSSAATINQFSTFYYNQPPTGSAEYKLAYNDDTLYIGGEISRTEADTLQNIVVLLSPADAVTDGIRDFQAITIPLSTAQQPTLTTVWNPSPDVNNLSSDVGKVALTAYDLQKAVTTNSLIIEMAIPLTSIVPTGVHAGDEWRMNIIHVQNLYTQPFSSWVPIRNSDQWHEAGTTARVRASVIDQDRLGSIYFSRLPYSLVPSGNSTVLWDTYATHTLLEYDGLTTKKIIFSASELSGVGTGNYSSLTSADVQLYWKAAKGQWQPLSTFTLTNSSGDYELSFTHPFPTVQGITNLQVILKPASASERRVAVFTFDREAYIDAGNAYFEAQHPTSPGTPTKIVSWSAASTTVNNIINMIPPQPGFIFVGLPEMPDLYPGNLYTLAPDNQSIIASRTSTVYPNSTYPESSALTLKNGKDETISIPYYEAGGTKYFITAHKWYLQKKKAVTQISSIANSDPLGAARILYAFAQAYEGYNPTVDRVAGSNHANISFDKRSGPPYAYWGGIWDRWWYNDLPTIKPLLQAYTNLKQSNAFSVLSTELGFDAEQYVVDRMIIPSTEFVLTYPDYLGNMSFQPWAGLIEVGKALNKPDYVHRAVEQIDRMASTMFLSDGYWQEVTQSYHLQTVNGMKAVTDALKGYSDPIGYVSPRTGKRFDNLDMEEEYPIIGKAIEYGNKLVYPDGKLLPIMDTWANTSVSAPIINDGSFLMPAARIARLVGGEGKSQTQLNLAFQPKYGHVHNDPLNLTLYAQGQELLPDLGYTHNSIYRYFALSTMSHNTVVVNSSNMNVNSTAKHGGNVETFVPDSGSFQTTRASYESAYPVTDEYSREPWFIPFADGTGEQGYVLDLFRVSGGSRHEYTLQGDANRDAYFETDLTLDDYGPYLLPPGTTVVQPTTNSSPGSAEGHYPGYIYVRDVKEAELTGDRYDVTLVTETAGTPGAKMNITGFLESGSNELYLGRSPSLRSIRLNGSSMDNNDEVVKYTMPKLVLRRDGTDLKSTFVTVMEPYRGDDSRLEVIEKLVPTSAPEGAVAVKVVYGDTTDIMLSNPNHPTTPLVVGDITLTGELGFIRLIDGQVREMTLQGGTLLQKGAQQVTSAGVKTGTIVETKRLADGDSYNALVVDTSVGSEAVGQYVIVTHPDQSTMGLEIGQVIPSGSNTILVLAEHDPGFTITNTGDSYLTYYPAKEWTGNHTFSIKGNSRSTFTAGTPISGSSTVTGYVRDADNNPLSGVMVHVAGLTHNSVVTDTYGQYTLTNVPAGAQYVTANRADYVWSTSSKFTVSGTTAAPTVHLTKPLPPKLENVTKYGVLLGDSIAATSTGAGAAHLVPVGTAGNKTAIEAASLLNGARVTISSGVPFTIHTSGLTAGRYMLYAIGASGLVSEGKPLAVLPVNMTAMDNSSPLITYVGKWDSFSNSLYSNGTMMLGREKDAIAHIPFYGTAAQVIADRHTARGLMNVYVDDEYVTTIDLYRSPIQYQQAVFSTGTLAEGVHRISLEVVGQRSTGSSGINVSFDGLGITLPAPFELYDVTTGAVTVGQPIAATSEKTGTLYLVPEATTPNSTSIMAAVYGTGASVSALADQSVTLSTYGLSSGWYKVYGIDTFGRVSVGSAPIAVVPIQSGTYTIDDTNAIVHYTGDWRNFTSTSYYGGTMKLGFESQAYVDIPFYGSSASLITDRHTARGKGDIYVDGVYVTTVDFYKSSPITYQQVTFHTGALPEGAHVIRVVANWTRHASSTGYTVPFDALKINP